ncbi:MAG: hypothetical protein HY719_02215 [Planctomycetes bacterium]|nr:hypothetical protein [Planctomycetota bacterium]
MFRYPFLLAVTFAILAVESTLLADGDFAPDLSLLFIVFLALHVEPPRVVSSCMVVAALEEVATSAPAGCTLLGAWVVAHLLRGVREGLFRADVLTLAFIAALAAPLFHAPAMAASLARGRLAADEAVARLAATSLYTVALAPVAMLMFHLAIRAAGARVRGRSYAF